MPAGVGYHSQKYWVAIISEMPKQISRRLSLFCMSVCMFFLRFCWCPPVVLVSSHGPEM